MGKSLQRKSFDVPATTISPSRTLIDAETSTAHNDTLSGAAMSDESMFDGDEFEDEFAYELGDSLEDQFDPLMEPEVFVEDYWEDASERERAGTSRDYIDDEFELGPSKDPMIDLFGDETHPQQSLHSTLRGVLERGMVRALAAHSSEQFLEQVVRSLDETVTTLRSDPASSPRNDSHRLSKQKSASKPHVAKQNGHHPGLKRQVERQPLIERLTHLKMLIQRYAKRGLQEWDVLDDAIALWSDTAHSNEITPLLAGLAARIALIPLAEGISQPLNSSLRKKLFSAAHRATTLLKQNRALSTLPGLAVNVGQHAVQLERPLSKLPQDFYQAATRVISNPSLQQRLANFKFDHAARGAIAPSQLPTKLRIDGPIEILLRRPQGQ